MHVKIDRHEQSQGFFKKRTLYCVTLTITFSEEEKAIIKKARLEDDYALLYKLTNYLDTGETIDHGTKFKELLKKPLVCEPSLTSRKPTHGSRT